MAGSANLLKVDLVRVLPVRRMKSDRGGASLVCSPATGVLTAAESPPAGMGLDHAEVWIIDPDRAVAQSLARMLHAEGLRASTFESAGAVLAQPEPALDGCIIADATTSIGLELQRELAAAQWLLPVIFLTSLADTRTVVRCMKAGAINCLPKPVQRGELLQAVREALTESRAVRAQRAAQLRVRQLLERLTPREREVLDLALDGLLVKQIAARLGTAEKTIKTHKGRLMRKMEVRSTLGLVQLMVTTGIPLRAAATESLSGTWPAQS